MNLLEIFRASSPGRQLLIVSVAAALLCALLFAAYFTLLRQPYRTLFANLRATDAATIVADLDKKKIPYRLADGGATILVPGPMVDATRLAVTSEDLPIKGTVGFELFNKSDMGLTEFAQKINYQRALQGELARTIMTMDAIDTARVHLSLPDPTIFRDDRRAPKASVTLIPHAGKTLSLGTVSGVRRLVAAAVPDLDPSNVVILDEDGLVLSGDAPPVELSALSPQLQQASAIGQFYAAEIRQALLETYPSARVQVTLPAAQGAASLATWTPADRSFPLVVTIDAGALLSPAQQEDARQRVGRALGRALQPGDQVNFAATSPPSALTSTPSAMRQGVSTAGSTSAALATPGSASSFWTKVAVALLLPLVFAAGYLARPRRMAGRRLNPQQRTAYVERLKMLLDAGEADAPDRI